MEGIAMNTTVATVTLTQPLRQRTQDRVPVRLPGILRVPDIRGGVYLVTVLDISKGGLRVDCPRPLPDGTRVEVKFNNSTVFGTTKYARPVNEQFHVGIEADRAQTRRQDVQGPELDLTALLVAGGTTARLK